MTESTWLQAIPAILIALVVLVGPGLAVLACFARLRPWTVALAPAVTLGIFGVSGFAFGVLGWRWNLWVMLGFTALIGTVAFLIRRRFLTDPPSGSHASASVAPAPSEPSWHSWAWLGAGLAAAACLVAYHFIGGIHFPYWISQSFDVTAHLNGIQEVLRDGNGSPFAFGTLSFSTFYPIGWHQTGALVATLSGVSIPVAAQATNLVIAAVVWPLGVASMTSLAFRNRPWIPALAAILAAGFGAFPYRLLEYGVVYPNFLAFALAPAALGLIIALSFKATNATASGQESVNSRIETWRLAILLVVVLAGVTFAHPNGAMAVLALSLPIVCWALGAQAVANYRTGRRSRAIVWGCSAIGYLALVALAWAAIRPALDDVDVWPGPTMRMRGALELAWLGTPVIGAWFWIGTLFTTLGLIAVVLRPSRLWLAGPWLVSAFLYVAAAATPWPGPRMYLVGVFFNNPHRVAALLPVAAILLGMAGAVGLVELWNWLLGKFKVAEAAWIHPVGWALATSAFAVTIVGVGPANEHLFHVRELLTTSHTNTHLLTGPERHVLEILDAYTDDESLLLVNPSTGAALAYALSGREVTERHIYGDPSDDVIFLAAHFNEIETNPEVCMAVNRLGVTHVLDFGSEEIFAPATPRSYAGLSGLIPGAHLVQLITVTADAELYRVDC